MFLGSSTPLPQGSKAQAIPNFGGSSIYTFTLTQNYQISRVNTYGEGDCFRWSATRPISRGWGPSAPQFFGAFLFMLTPFVAELPNFTHWERVWLVFRWLATTPPQGCGPSAPFHLSVQPLSQNHHFDVETHVRDERVSRGQPGLLSPKSEVPVLLIFWDFPVFIPTSINTVYAND